MGITKNGWPIESTLKNLRSGLLRTEVASTCMIMAKGEDILLVTLRNTSPYNLIWAIFKQVRIIPKKMFYLSQEF
jgi:hypothetical protein